MSRPPAGKAAQSPAKPAARPAWRYHTGVLSNLAAWAHIAQRYAEAARKRPRPSRK